MASRIVPQAGKKSIELLNHVRFAATQFFQWPTAGFPMVLQLKRSSLLDQRDQDTRFVVSKAVFFRRGDYQMPE
jgi:hypothetical protein